MLYSVLNYSYIFTFRADCTKACSCLFTSKVNNECISSYSNFAATQFEPLRARRAFPCMDEPALKATFNMTIAHRPEYIALSNMPLYRSEVVNGQTHDHFLQTVVMPTYLVALVVGEFEFLKTVTKNGVEVCSYQSSMCKSVFYVVAFYGWSISQK